MTLQTLSEHEIIATFLSLTLLLAGAYLCEKPMVLAAQQALELFDIAKERGLILMEAIKTAYCPGFRRLVSCAKSGKIGRTVSVDATFTKLVPSCSRELQNDGVGGSVNELATYPLLAILKLLDMKHRDIRFTSYKNSEDGVDLFTRIDLSYPEAVATAKVGLGVKSEGSMVISGTRGYVYVPVPWWKTEYFELRYENPAETEKNFYKFSGDGLRYEIVEFLNQIASRQMDERMCRLSSEIAGILEQYRTGTHTTTIRD